MKRAATCFLTVRLHALCVAACRRLLAQIGLASGAAGDYPMPAMETRHPAKPPTPGAVRSHARAWRIRMPAVLFPRLTPAFPRIRWSAICYLATAVLAAAAEFPVQPYTDPAQLDVPWPKHSFYRQAWRGFLETRSGADFLNGIGINYNVPANDELAVRLLAEAGFTTFRIEIGWGGERWDESGFTREDRIGKKLALCKQHGIRPLILLNAHHGVPCPARFFNGNLAADANKGDRLIRLKKTDGIEPGRTGLSQLTQYWAAEAIITKVNRETGECVLSKPLPKDISATGTVPLATLKFLPLYPVGSPEFENTARGWVRYALLACKLVRDAGIDSFDVEIWNELSFGSNFTSINHYYDPPLIKSPKNFLHEGGPAWEMARRTIEAVKKEHPHARCIWGFSNTTFHHTPVAKLPPGTDGQSYHPYGTGTRTLPDQETHRDHPEFNLEGYTPPLEIRMPEGWAHTFIQTECIMRLLNPAARTNRPPDTKRFFHYMTEHGVAPPECGITDADGAWKLKAKCALRSYLLWMNKGIDVLAYYCAYEHAATGMGLMPTNLPVLSADAKFADIATPPMKAVRNLTRAFGGSVPLAATTPLRLDVTSLGEQRKVFDGDGTHPPLWHRDVFAALPFQTGPRSFIIACYVMTCDITKPIADETYRLTIGNLPTAEFHASLYDPFKDRTVPVKMVKRTDGEMTVELPAQDSPRLLMLSP